MKASFLVIAVLACTVHAGYGGEVIHESFDGWIKNAYADPSVYSNAHSGVWVTDNAIVGTQNARSGRAVRFSHRAGIPPYLEYRGPDGQGLRGGISGIHFYYRHWNGSSDSVRFILQTSTNRIHWTSRGAEVPVSSAVYQEFEWTGVLLEEPLFIRLLSTANDERMLIDDFSIQPYGGPRLYVENTSTLVCETQGVLSIPAWVHPPGEASAEIVTAGGDALAGVHYELLTTHLVFTHAAPTQAIEFLVHASDEPCGDRNALFSFVNLDVAVPAAGHESFGITILDAHLPRATISPAQAEVVESGEPMVLTVSLSRAADAGLSLLCSGTAQQGRDFSLSSTTLLFSASGPTQQDVTFTPVDNNIGDGDLEAILTVVPLHGAEQATSNMQAVVTILDDEPFAHFGITDFWMEEGETNRVIEMVLDEPRDAVVHIGTSGNALYGLDYSLSSTSVVFTSTGSLTQRVYMTAHVDHIAEGPERVILTLEGNEGFRPGPQAVCHVGIQDADSITLMTANLTSGSGQRYREHGRRLLRGLMPDVVSVQEFNVEGSRRDFVDEVFGTNYHYVVDLDHEGGIPCGVISRWPIKDWGVWHDPVVGNRDFVWATINIPHVTNRLHMVNAHFYAGGTPSQRNQEAEILRDNMTNTFNAGDFVVVAGDLNTGSRAEAAIVTLSDVVSDLVHPVDQYGNPFTNRGRNSPYDYVLPCSRLESLQIPYRVGYYSFPEGLVFDSRLWDAPPHPIETTDSAAENMQHMGVLKTFAAAPKAVSLSGPFWHVTTSGRTAWLNQTNVIWNGLPALQSGFVEANGTNSLFASIAGPGRLSFWWKLSSSDDSALLSLYTNGHPHASIQGETDWEFIEILLAPGSYHLEWRFEKEGNHHRGECTAWIADISCEGEPDRDADGLPDAWELRFFGSPTGAERDADPDGDGHTNWQEFVADTHPNDPNHFLHIARVDAGTPMIVHFAPSSTGRLYSIQYTTNLATGIWHTLSAGENRMGTGGQDSFVIENGATSGYFRVRVALPPGGP